MAEGNLCVRRHVAMGDGDRGGFQVAFHGEYSELIENEPRLRTHRAKTTDHAN